MKRWAELWERVASPRRRTRSPHCAAQTTGRNRWRNHIWNHHNSSSVLMLDGHLFVALPQPLAAGVHDAVGVNVADVVDPLVVEADGSVLPQHPVVDVDHVAVCDAAAAIGAGADGLARKRGRTGSPPAGGGRRRRGANGRRYRCFSGMLGGTWSLQARRRSRSTTKYAGLRSTKYLASPAWPSAGGRRF